MPETKIIKGSFKIKVKTLEGNILTFRKVKEYVLDSGMIQFTDSKFKTLKKFSTSQCEIQEEDCGNE